MPYHDENNDLREELEQINTAQEDPKGKDVLIGVFSNLNLTPEGQLFALNTMRNMGIDLHTGVGQSFDQWRNKLLRHYQSSVESLTECKNGHDPLVSIQDSGVLDVDFGDLRMSFTPNGGSKFNIGVTDNSKKGNAFKIQTLARSIIDNFDDAREIANKYGVLSDDGSFTISNEFIGGYIGHIESKLGQKSEDIWAGMYNGDQSKSPEDIVSVSLTNQLVEAIDEVRSSRGVSYEEAQKILALENCIDGNEVLSVRREIGRKWLQIQNPSENPNLTGSKAVELANQIEDFGILNILDKMGVEIEEHSDIFSTISEIGGNLARPHVLTENEEKVIKRVANIGSHKKFMALIGELGLTAETGNVEIDNYNRELVMRLYNEAGVPEHFYNDEIVASTEWFEYDHAELQRFAQASTLYLMGIGSITENTAASIINIDSVIENIKKIQNSIREEEPIDVDYYYALVNSRNPLRTGGNMHLDLSEIQMVHTLFKPVEVAKRMGLNMRWIIVNEATEVNHEFGIDESTLEENVEIVETYANNLGYGDNLIVRSMKKDIRGILENDEFHEKRAQVRDKLLNGDNRLHRAIAFGASLNEGDMADKGISQPNLDAIYAHTFLETPLPNDVLEVGAGIAADFDSIMSLRDRATDLAREKFAAGKIDELPPQYGENVVHVSITRKDVPIEKRVKPVIVLWPKIINPNETLFATHGIGVIQDENTEADGVNYKSMGNIELWRMLIADPEMYRAHSVGNRVVALDFLPEDRVRARILSRKLEELQQLVS